MQITDSEVEKRTEWHERQFSIGCSKKVKNTISINKKILLLTTNCVYTIYIRLTKQTKTETKTEAKTEAETLQKQKQRQDYRQKQKKRQQSISMRKKDAQIEIQQDV